MDTSHWPVHYTPRYQRRNRLNLGQTGLFAAAALAYSAYKNRKTIKKVGKFVAHSIPVAASMYVKKRSSGGPYPSPSKVRVVAPSSRGRSTRSVAAGPGSASMRSVASQTNSGRRIRYVPYPRKKRRNGGYGKGRKRRRRLRKNKMYITPKDVIKRCYLHGATIRHEGGSVINDNFCVTIGHTVPVQQVRRAFFMSMIKRLLDKAGITMESPETVINLVGVGDQIYLYYRYAPVLSNPTLLNISITFAASESIATLTNKLIAVYETAGIAGNNQYMQLESLLFLAANPANDLASVRISLIGATASFYHSSEMKLQNRTSNGVTNTQSDDLVAQYVTGKSYYGYGNYCQSRTRGATPGSVQLSVIGNYIGVMGSSNFSTQNPDDQMKEPMPKNHFVNAISSNNVRFGPGELKRSKLFYKCTMPISEFLQYIVRSWDLVNGVFQNLTEFPQKKGKFRFFQLEKEIETIYNASPATPVSIAIETNNTVGVVITPHNNTFMSRENIMNREIPSA